MMHLSEAAVATRGQVIGQDVMFTNVGTDSRKLADGQLFVALQGERFDGHAYAPQTLDQGAVAAMVSREVAALPSAIMVKDTRLALGDLAAYWRRKFDIPLAAITGSNGKTTVKEMLASILRIEAGGDDYVLATEGNLNNDIGLPLTLLKLRTQHRYAVAEMGMNHSGEISYLTRIGKPTVALVNNATTAHVGELGSVEAIARAKGEIFEGLADDGVAVINADDAFASLWRMLSNPHQVMTFGLDMPADVTATYTLASDRSDIHLRTPEGNVDFELPAPGLHNVRNALAAATVALAMGASLASIAQGLSTFSGAKGRLQRKSGIQGATVLDDTYNANPASVKAAIDVLAANSGTRLLVLGDMGELGAEAPAMHAAIGSYAKAAGIDALYTLGELSRHMVEAFGGGAQRYETPESLVADLKAKMDPDAIVLVKVRVS
jgi:UDP-N-acetylmuramoyl-tripeptide--D-alanyl-D-alanine ligase